MERYTPGFLSDLELLAWYLHLGETGDIDTAFGRVANCLSIFFDLFKAPTELWIARDANGWYAACWLTPIMDGVTYSLWLREDQRQSKEGLAFINETVSYAAATWPVTLFLTRSEAVAKMGKHFGFQTLGDVPYLFDGETAHVGVMTSFDREAAVNEKVSNGG